MRGRRLQGLKISVWALFGSAILVSANPLQVDRAVHRQAERPFTGADAIRMTKVSGTAFTAFNPKTGFAKFSPNGRLFAIVLRRGNTQRNTNDYSLLLFRVAEVFRKPHPKVLLSISSASNNAG